MRTAIVTGGSRGIGRASCLALARDGFTVYFTFAHRESDAQETLSIIEGLGGEARMVRADASDPDAARSLAETVLRETGRIDALVNCAGILGKRPFLEITRTEWDEVLKINLTGPFYNCQAVLPVMLEQGRGSIINVSSLAGERGSATQASYAAAKAGLIGLTKSIAREFGTAGIRANAVTPGRIVTEMLERTLASEKDRYLRETPLGRLGTVAEVAEVIAFLASDASSYVTGHTFQVNGGVLMN